MKQKNKLLKRFFTIASMMLFVSMYGQQQTVTGTISDNTGQPLPGANILEQGTTNGTQSDFDGNYTIEADQTSVLVFSYLGFTTQEVAVGNQTVINVTLSEDASILDEVVVIGYGSQARTTLTTAVTKLDEAVLENIPFANAANALQGSVSGVRVQQTSGQPGASANIVVRGGASINDPNGARPLYIVDGVIRDDINGLNPADIENLQVLKDAAATSIYGSRGSNGVVLITSKSGKSGRVSVEFNSSVEISNLRERYDFGTARDYVKFGRLGALATSERSPERIGLLDGSSGFGTGNDLSNNTAFTLMVLNDSNRDIYQNRLINEGWEEMPDPADPSRTLIFKNTDWQDVMFRTGVSQNYNFAVGGGSENATFRASLGYQNAEGIVIFTKFDRLTLNIGGSVKVNDKLSVNGNFNFSNVTDYSVHNQRHVFTRWLGAPPTMKYRNIDGTLAAGRDSSRGNPEFLFAQFLGQNNLSKYTMALGLDWELAPGLHLKPSASLYTTDDLDNRFTNSYTEGRGRLVDSRNAEATDAKWWQKQMDVLLTYDKSINDAHNFDALLGFSFYDRQRYRLRATGRGAATNLIPTLNASAEPLSVFSDHTQLRILGYLGRLNYNFKKKYLFSFNFRYDGASSLSKDNLWGFFPGISAGWNVHEEPFFNIEAINNLKLRASFGVNGNINAVNGSINGNSFDNLNPFNNDIGVNRDLNDFTSAQGEFSTVRYGGTGGARQSSLANADLKWERSETLNLGLDLGLFKNRINVLFDYYRRKTNDLLTDVSLPQSTGFATTITNLATIENKGFEIDLSARIVDNPEGFNWKFGAIANYNENTILELPDNGLENNRIGGVEVFDPATGTNIFVEGFQEGKALGDVYSWEQVGVYSTSAEAANAPLDEIITRDDKTKVAGDAILLDLNNDGVLNLLDMTRQGNALPDWTGGITNKFSYKGLSLSVRMDYSVGHIIQNAARARYNGQWQGDQNITKNVVNDSWLAEGDQTTYPRYYWADQLAQNNNFRAAGPAYPQSLGFQGNNIRTTSFYFEKGDYLSLREITLDYQIPVTTTLEKIGLSKLRIFATGRNLHYFTKYTGLSPENGGGDFGRYPIPRSFILGLNASF